MTTCCARCRRGTKAHGELPCGLPGCDCHTIPNLNPTPRIPAPPVRETEQAA